jgi:hypothetical protein
MIKKIMPKREKANLFAGAGVALIVCSCDVVCSLLNAVVDVPVMSLL